MLTVRRIGAHTTLVTALALATASVAVLAGPREGDHGRFMGNQRRSEGSERNENPRPAPAQRRENDGPHWGAARPAFSPPAARPPVFTPAPHPAWRPTAPPQQVFGPRPAPREPDRDRGGDQTRTWQPIGGHRGDAQRTWDRRDGERHEWGNRDAPSRDRDRTVWQRGRGGWDRNNSGRGSWQADGGYGRDWNRHEDRERHWYPSRGYVVDRLPVYCRPVVHFRERFFFGDGIWYQPFGARFVVVAPPIGLVIPILPSLYATLWVGGVPFYYANDTYYRWSDPYEGYQVVERPAEAEVESATYTPEEIYVYPRNNQNEEQQSADRYTCHRWSVDQTGYDPSDPAKYSRAGDAAERRAQYRRAMEACLNARGYSVT